MPHVLIIDDMAICRDPIEFALKAHGFETSTAGGGSEAFFEMSQSRPDVVLLDVTMPEMDGLSVLRAMRRNPQLSEIPVILLTDRSDSATVLEAARLHVSGYVLKSNFTVGGLMSTLAKCVSAMPAESSSRDGGRENLESHPVAKSASKATSEAKSPPPQPTTLPSRRFLPSGHDGLDDLSPVIARRELRDLVSHGLELRPLGATVQQVMALTANPNCSVDDISHAVSQDQALSVRLLKTANSTAFTRGKPVDTIKVAVQRLGIQEVRNLVTTLAVLDQFNGSISAYMDARLFWEHSVSCGVIAQRLAVLTGYPTPDDCFLWGVLHDVGRLILIDRVPELYHRVWQISHERALPLVSVERNMLTLDHGDILARALEHWRFSNDFIVPAVNHHRTVAQLRRLGSDHMRGAAIVSASNAIAHALLLGDSGDRTVPDAGDVLEVLDLSELNIDDLRETVEDQTKDIKFALLSRGDQSSWPDYSEQVRASVCSPVRPLFVSSSPHTDTLRAFFDRLSGVNSIDAPNVAVIVCGPQSPFETQLRRLAKQEEEAQLTLPILVIALDKVTCIASHSERQLAICRAPLNINLCVDALNHLLGVEHASTLTC